MERVTIVPRLPQRESDAHKGDFGKVLVIAGSIGMSGAAVLVGKSALRSGAGLVRVAVPQGILPIVATMEPCYTTIPLAQDETGSISESAVNTILDAAADNDVIAMGPGLRFGSGVCAALTELLSMRDVKIVLDADSLNNLAKLKGWEKHLRAQVILTPHPGEMKRLWSAMLRDPLPQDRIETAAAYAEKTGAVVVLKGAGTVVTDSKKVYVNETGNPGMATGGSGDVLTGIIAALWAQKMDRFDAAVLAVYVHGLAGDAAAAKRGEISLIATDIIDFLADGFRT